MSRSDAVPPKQISREQRPMIDSPYGRDVEEWRSDNPNAMPPPLVRLRIFDRARGICHISGRKIMPGDKWDLEHKVAISLGGENRERNLAPALADKHKGKTALDRALKADLDAKRARHIGVKAQGRKLRSRNTFKPSPKNSRDINQDMLDG